MNKSMFSSASDNWPTPQSNFNELAREFAFELDVCADKENTKCARFFTREDDGLKQTWGGYCWMNPPYGREIGAWTRRCLEVAKFDGVEVIALVPARVDARWFRDCWDAVAICFVYGRLRFLGAESSAPFPSALVYWGTWRNKFACACNEAALGRVIEP